MKQQQSDNALTLFYKKQKIVKDKKEKIYCNLKRKIKVPSL